MAINLATLSRRLVSGLGDTDGEVVAVSVAVAVAVVVVMWWWWLSRWLWYCLILRVGVSCTSKSLT